jgi:short-subunit dehydrogenase
MKTIVITGSTRGIGLAMAKTFLATGCQVTLSGRGESLGAGVQNELNAYEDKYIYIPCDVQCKSDLLRLWNKSKDTWGQIDIWINNAGQNAPNAFVYETDESYVNKIIATNITGMVYGSQIAAKEMLLQKHGAIYSMEGLGSNNMIQKKTILYGMTKHALTYFMKGLAKELDGTSVIAGRLSPGMMLTDFITKTPDGKTAAIEQDERFQRLFNILADKPETVAAFFVPRILANKRNNVQISWLTNRKAAYRFLMAPIVKRKLL